MFKFVTLALIGAVAAFNNVEESTMLGAKTKKTAGQKLVTQQQSYALAKKQYDAAKAANTKYLDAKKLTRSLKAGLKIETDKYTPLKKAADKLAAGVDTLKKAHKKLKAISDAIVKKEGKKPTQKSKDALALTKAALAKHDAALVVYKKSKGIADKQKAIMNAVSKKYVAAKKISDALTQGQSPVEPKKGKALKIMTNIILKKDGALFAPVSVTWQSSAKEFTTYTKIIAQETTFWTTLVKEVKGDAKKKVLVPGANYFLKANKDFTAAIAAQAKLLKAKKATSGKDAFKAAAGTYMARNMKASYMIAKAMETYESKANKAILKGYTTLYEKALAKQTKLNEKAKGGSMGIIIGALVGVSVIAGAVWWFKCRKTE